MVKKNQKKIIKVETGISGFDLVSLGGLPKYRTTLVSGTSGSAKTVFGTQFLIEGMKNNQNGAFITFEESPEDIRKNMLGFGWDIAKFESEGKWSFVDGTADPVSESITVGDYDLGALLVRIEHAVNKVNAERLCMDSLGSIFSQFNDSSIVRRELFKIAYAIKKMGVTAILTAERTEEYGDIARFGVEEFVADNVIILRNVLEIERRRRTLEILKFRGTSHHKGEYPFTITDEGIILMPLSAIELVHKSSDIRISTGQKTLDAMCGGGYFRDSIILISGATGTGKTLMATEFISGGTNKGVKCLLFAFEESREQLLRNAKGWGIDFEAMEGKGLLKIECAYPESASLEDHLISMREKIDLFDPKLIAVDSLSALERVSTIKGFREFIIGLTSYIKERETAGLFTAVTASLMGGVSVTEAHISTITDSIILLRYVELFGEMRRGITVLKMRGSMHEKEIREYNIDGNGMQIGKPFRNVSGILSGSPQHVIQEDIERMEEMFA